MKTTQVRDFLMALFMTGLFSMGFTVTMLAQESVHLPVVLGGGETIPEWPSVAPCALR